MAGGEIRRLVVALGILGAVLGSGTVRVSAAAYCSTLFNLDAAALSEQLALYNRLNAGDHISASTWQDAEAVYKKAFSFSSWQSTQYCDSDAKLQDGLVYVLHTVNGYLYKGSDLKWAANWLQTLEPSIGQGALTLDLYRDLLMTTYRGLKDAHENIPSDFRSLVEKYSGSSTP
jgi:hypothetical protein